MEERPQVPRALLLLPVGVDQQPPGDVRGQWGEDRLTEQHCDWRTVLHQGGELKWGVSTGDTTREREPTFSIRHLMETLISGVSTGKVI